MDFYKNMKKRKEQFGGTRWNIVFIAAVWQSWKNINKQIFENVTTNFQWSNQIVHYASEIDEAFQAPLSTINHHTRLIRWWFPNAGKVKLNIDGSSNGSPGRARFGGVLRNERGAWVLGYFRKLENATSTEAELRDIYRGLTIMLEKGFREVEIKKQILKGQPKMIQGGTISSPCRAMVGDSSFLLQRCGCTMKHILRKGNHCADIITNLGVNQIEILVIVDDPPEQIKVCLIADMAGTTYVRG